MGFKTEPPELPAPKLGKLSAAETLKDWIGEAPLKHTAPVVASTPWQGMAKDEAPAINFNLRLNNYERTLLAHAAEQGHRSMQAEAKRVLFAELERLYGGSKVAPKRIRRRAAAEPKKRAG